MSVRTLHPAGVALILFSGSKHRLTVPNVEEGRPGIKCTQQGDDVLIQARGWETPQQAADALIDATAILLDAGFDVQPLWSLPPSSPPSGVVSRRKVPPR